MAVVSDRGCDRVRFYKIDPTDPDGPLVDITAPNVPRVFPTRYEQPSTLQPSGAVEGWRDNPVDDQNTVYGLTVSQGDVDVIFVSSASADWCVSSDRAAPGGRLTYRPMRTFLFKTTFRLRDGSGALYDWTPCREAALEEPQSEGLVFDRREPDALRRIRNNRSLQAAARQVDPGASSPSRATSLIEPVKSFGQAYHATPDDDEFECAYSPADPPAPGEVVAAGSDANAGRFLEADLEGLSIIASLPGRTLLLASSQGDSSFHFYDISRSRTVHRGAFFVEGVGDTDGVHYVPVPLGRQFPLGLLVIQNGEAPEPPDTGDVNGYEFDGATQFLYLDFADALKALVH